MKNKKTDNINLAAQNFWCKIEEELVSNTLGTNEKVIDSKVIRNDSEKFEIYVFANFDICNFTKYKREHSNWVELLQNFLYTVSNPTSDWSISRFWKFNGDSLTFRKKVKSVDEICVFIEQTQGHLIQLQNFLNKENKSYKKIYVKAAVWVAGFSNSKEEHIVNNTRFCKSPFGEEFVGENIDEDFRLSTCSKAGKLVVDPKIVLIVYMYSILCSFVEKNKSEIDSMQYRDTTEFETSLIRKIDKDLRQQQILYDVNDEKTKNIILHIVQKLTNTDFKKFHDSVNKIRDSFYLMEYSKCKGVWDDRDYPIFWYINDLQHCELVYDEIINGENLRDHRLNKLINTTIPVPEKNEDYCYFKNARTQLLNICAQIEVLSSVDQLVKHLSPYPLGVSEETIYDTANLYYMVACVLIKEGKDEGVLVFKRTNSRKHLKFVWDLVPIKHAKTYKANEVYGICDYLKNMLNKKLNLINPSFDISEKFTIPKDEVRDSIKPIAFCNVYRNGENHNGILCMAEVVIDSTVDEFLSKLNQCIKSDPAKQYDQVRLVSLENIKDSDIIIENSKLTIKSLSPYEVKRDSDNVAIDDSFISFLPKSSETNFEYGISFLGDSIKQILEGRKNAN